MTNYKQVLKDYECVKCEHEAIHHYFNWNDSSYTKYIVCDIDFCACMFPVVVVHIVGVEL